MSQVKMSQADYDKKIAKIKLCGQNMGSHAYQPVSWIESGKEKHVTMFMCTVCFTRVQVKTLYEQFEEATV